MDLVDKDAKPIRAPPAPELVLPLAECVHRSIEEEEKKEIPIDLFYGLLLGDQDARNELLQKHAYRQ